MELTASWLGVRAEYRADGGGFGGIVGQRAGAVRVDVADRFRRDAGVAQGRAHGPRRALGGRLGDVAGVGRHAEADDLGVNARAARARGFERLQHQHGRAFAQNHAAAVLRKRPAGIGRHHAHGLPGFQNAEAERRFAAAG